MPQSKRCLPNREPPPVTIVPRWGGGGRREGLSEGGFVFWYRYIQCTYRTGNGEGGLLRGSLPMCPWRQEPMLCRRGDQLILNSELVHAGGTAAPGMRVRYVAFAAFGTHAYDYDRTNPSGHSARAARASSAPLPPRRCASAASSRPCAWPTPRRNAHHRVWASTGGGGGAEAWREGWGTAGEKFTMSHPPGPRLPHHAPDVPARTRNASRRARSRSRGPPAHGAHRSATGRRNGPVCEHPPPSVTQTGTLFAGRFPWTRRKAFPHVSHRSRAPCPGSAPPRVRCSRTCTRTHWRRRRPAWCCTWGLASWWPSPGAASVRLPTTPVRATAPRATVWRWPICPTACWTLPCWLPATC